MSVLSRFRSDDAKMALDKESDLDNEFDMFGLEIEPNNDDGGPLQAPSFIALQQWCGRR